MNGREVFVLGAKKKRRKSRSGILKKWKQITSRLGTRVEKQLHRIAKCYARNTTELNLESNCTSPILQGSFADNAIGENNLLITRARVGRGKRYVFVFTTSPPKKSSLLKIFGFVFFFSNLTLKSREARGIPKNQWLSLANAKENSEKLSLSTLLVGLYADLLTYFTK